jgi:hypothetical protein
MAPALRRKKQTSLPYSTPNLVRQNVRAVKKLYPQLGKQKVDSLRDLTQTFKVSIPKGEITSIEGNWYITHTGLLGIAQRRGCLGIRTVLEYRLSDPSAGRWVFKAVVHSSPRSKGFVGYGDADSSNVPPHLHGCELRIAETRAVNRALRKAYGVGLCSVEELGAFSPVAASTAGRQNDSRGPAGNGSGNGQPRLRDRFCLLIRQHQLDPTLVKRYAAEFCGTPALREASREQVEAFINHLAEWAMRDREGLVCKLNSYAQAEERKR